MESMAEEIVREILLKLLTRDVLRCRCVSRQWRDLLNDPSFTSLHAQAAHVLSGPCAETLVVREIRGHVMVEMAVLNASSAKHICTDFYRPTNACNGFLLLSPTVRGWPLFVCNPIAGEKLEIPAPPGIRCFQKFAMGFSRSTGQYKLFHLSSEWCQGTLRSYLEAYTLGDNVGSWRQHPHTFVNRALDYAPPPVLVDGKLYILTGRSENPRVPYRMLVIDVATETHFTYCLPEVFTEKDNAAVYPFELCGQLCVAVRIVGRRLLHFWVMPPLRGFKDIDEGMLHGDWELRYTIYMADDGRGKYDNRPSDAWLDNSDGMLCYRLGDCLYKYDTTEDDEEKNKQQMGDSSEWSHQIQLPVARWPDFQRWSVYGGYRPSLLSPHHLAFRRKNDEI
jgi:F-box interacting protein